MTGKARERVISDFIKSKQSSFIKRNDGSPDILLSEKRVRLTSKEANKFISIYENAIRSKENITGKIPTTRKNGDKEVTLYSS